MRTIKFNGKTYPFRRDPLYVEQWEEEHGVSILDSDMISKVKSSKIFEFLFMCVIKGIETHNRKNEDKMEAPSKEELFEDLDIEDVWEGFSTIEKAPKKKGSNQ